MKARSGFTLIEMIIFVAIFSLAMAAFMAVFTNVANIQVNQNSASEVRSQSQFIMQTLQYYIGRSSLIEFTADTATTSLKLRMSSSTQDPTYITLSGGAIYLKLGAGASQSITSNKINVSELTFTKRQNSGGHDSVAVALTVGYVTNSPQQRFSQSLRTSISRSSSANFDSGIVPATGNTFSLGDSVGDWRSINDTIFLGEASVGHNVGIGGTYFSPSSRLHINGDLRVDLNAGFGDIYVDSSANGLVLRSTDDPQVCYRLLVSNKGVLSTNSTACL